MIVVEGRLSGMIMFIVVFTTATVGMLTGFGNFGIAQAQGNLTTGNSTLTPEQRVAICDPNNPSSKLDFVNTTESRICGIPKTPTNTTTEEAANSTATIGTETSSSPDTTIDPSGTSSTSRSTTTTSNQSSLYEEGYAKGVSDAKLIQSSSPASATMSPNEVDCDSSVDPQASNQDYCSGYQHGFANTNNNALAGK
jgi:hypothetical protein